MNPLARTLVGAVAVAALAGSQALALPGLGGGGGGYSVSGKPGPFVRQVASRNLDAAAAGGASLGLADDAINRGEFQAARLRMPQTEARISQLLGRIDAQWPYARRPVKVQILGLEQYGAQALPDGSLVVSFGLIDQAESDDEIAFVLGHELGHIRLNHFAAGVKLEKRKQAMSELGQIYVIGSSVRSGARDVMAGGSGVGALSAEGEAAGKRAAAANDLIHYINDVLVAPAWSRAQEDEADALGFDLSEGGQFAAESGAAKVFDTIQADEDHRAAQTDALQKQLQQEMTAAAGPAAVSMLSGGVSSRGLRDSALKFGGKLALSAAASSDGGPKHRPPAARKKGMADYTSDAYPKGLPARDETHAWLDGVRASPEFQQAKVAVVAVGRSMKARADGAYPVAMAELNRAFTTSFGNAPLVLNEAARLQDDIGQVDQADRLFSAAHRSPDQTVDGYLDHVRMLYRVGRYDRAEQVIAQGAQRFGNDDKPFLSMEVAIADARGDTGKSDRLMQRCNAAGREDLAKDCKLARRRGGGGDDTQTAEAKKPSGPSLGKVLGGLPFGPH